MEHEDADWLRRALDRRLEAVETRFHRDLYGRIDWNDRLIGIRGPRGAGKTTMLLQRVKEAFPDRDKVLFASVENIWFANHPLEDVVEWHWTHGGTHVFLDEIHRLPDWQARVKALYDDFPGLSFVYTGSSMLHIDHARGDLSRRQRLWELPVLSFREFLEMEGFSDIAPVPLETLLADHRALAEKVCAGRRILPLFERYLRSGLPPM
ncbi:MAG: AAA family ATPase [Acidaminococcaceae bacterium]|nr:AAA family ATPase [Acidaminococcaceae bacterium]